jgi:hypothetical protein
MIIRSKKLWQVISVVFAAVLAVFLLLAIIGSEVEASPHDVTTTHMFIIQTRICAYIEERGTLPASLAQLPDRDGEGDVNKDGWGGNIAYLVNSNGVVTLKSMGGGFHIGRDLTNYEITKSFPTKDSNGNWRKGLGAEY